MATKVIRTHQQYTSMPGEGVRISSEKEVLDMLDGGVVTPSRTFCAKFGLNDDKNMSLTISLLSRPFTISTYDPPSTCIALAAVQDQDQRRQEGKKGNRLGYKPGDPGNKDSPSTVEGSGRPWKETKTPSTRAKVLPWIYTVEENHSPPEGFLGPYDPFYEVSTRQDTMQEVPLPPLPSPPRQIHPFAYNPGTSLPFSTLVQDISATEYLEEQAQGVRHTRPDSEVLSRGAGKRPLGQPLETILGGVRVIPTRVGGSARMDFFERESSMDPLRQTAKSSDSPHKPDSSPVKSARHPPNEPLPTTPKANSIGVARGAKTPSESDLRHPHVQHPHHEFPFNPQEAARKQATAMEAAELLAEQQDQMEAARAEALARLEAAQGGLQPAGPGGPKGPRETYDTATSGPSFGHLFHQDGMPVSRHMSMQPPPGQEPRPGQYGRGLTGLGSGAFIRIPFGVPSGMTIPRPLMVMRNSAGAGVGLGLSELRMPDIYPRLSQVMERPETYRRDDRSAYVEDVTDEQEHTEHSAKTQAQPRNARSTAQVPPTGYSPSRTEPGIDPKRSTTGQPGVILATQNGAHLPPNLVGAGASSALAPTHRTALSRRKPVPDSDDGSARAHRSPAPGPKNAKTHSDASDARTYGSDPTAKAASRAPSDAETAGRSIAPTTATDVKRLVADSKFHDDTLCQLLDAARLNLIGGQAKKALNRAARARVIELRDLRGQGELVQPGTGLFSRKHKGDNACHRHTTRSRSGSDEPSPVRAEPTTPPQWAQDIISRLAAIDARFTDLEMQQREVFQDDATPPSQDIAADLINDLLFHDLPSSGFNPGMLKHHGFGALDNGGPRQPSGMTGDTPQGAYLRTLSPSVKISQEQNGDAITWGSEVELPAPGESFPLPHVPPTIHVQAPTDSNFGKSQRAVTPAPSQAPRTPKRIAQQIDIDIYKEHIIQEHETALPDPKERDLPATPSESIRSNCPSPVPETSPLLAGAHRVPRPPTSVPQTQFRTPPATTAQLGQPASQACMTSYHTALADPVEKDPSMHRDKLHIIDPINPHLHNPTPWDLVTQRLYSWAMVWDEGSFVRAMERISLGEQIEEFPLSVFVMTTFKRMLRHVLSETPARSCDKLFIPPNMADAINKAVHSKNFQGAQEILEELWYPFGFTEPPRVIVALSKHRNDADHWTAHRFDLVTHRLTTYSVYHDESLPDGRPFMWWHAIRRTWPQYEIPDPDSLAQRFVRIQTKPERRHDNSLEAANYSRNLFLGYRPERAADLTKLREMIWSEVKSLLQKKRSGSLILEQDSPRHVYDV